MSNPPAAIRISRPISSRRSGSASIRGAEFFPGIRGMLTQRSLLGELVDHEFLRSDRGIMDQFFYGHFPSLHRHLRCAALRVGDDPLRGKRDAIDGDEIGEGFFHVLMRLGLSGPSGSRVPDATGHRNAVKTAYVTERVRFEKE